MKGLIFGKFMPPTMGHKYLIDSARDQVDRLFVFVGDVYEDSIIPRPLRARWLRAHYGASVEILAPSQDALAEEISSDVLLERWRNLVLDSIGGAPDRLFGSEAYLAHIAEAFRAEFVPVDEARGAVPISATQIRADPMRHWDMILPEARGYFRRTVVVAAERGEELRFPQGVDVEDLRAGGDGGTGAAMSAAAPGRLLVRLVLPRQLAAVPSAHEERWFSGPDPIVALAPARGGAGVSASPQAAETMTADELLRFIRQQLEG